LVKPFDPLVLLDKAKALLSITHKG
jgi:hypothetical protein